MKTLPHIVIVDYGVGNLWSLSKALAQFADVEITEERQRIEKADAIILPGVGTFKAGMEGLSVRGLVEVIKEVTSFSSVPVIAHGGAGTPADMVEAARAGVEAVCASSLFHYSLASFNQVKGALTEAKYPVRTI